MKWRASKREGGQLQNLTQARTLAGPAVCSRRQARLIVNAGIAPSRRLTPSSLHTQKVYPGLPLSAFVYSFPSFPIPGCFSTGPAFQLRL
jgi:hypothetical protein